MNEENQIEIPLSKSKMIVIIIGSLAFVGLGLWFLTVPPQMNNSFLANPTVILVVSIISILFFGLISITVFRKLLDNKPGLIINSQGITDNSSGVSAGLIPWEDIVGIETTQVRSQRFLMIMVKNPEYYLDKVSNPIKRNTMRMNHRFYGSPISISATALQTNFNELHDVLNEKMKQFK
ncbi:MAG: STM3941 family protein [Nonlabens sp.]